MSCLICLATPARTALPNSHACGVCGDELTKALDDIEKLTPVLRALLQPGRVNVDSQLRRVRISGSPAPLRIDVLSLLDERNQAAPEQVIRGWAKAFGVDPTCAALRLALGRIIEDRQIVPFARDIRKTSKTLVLVCGPRITDQPPRKVATCQREIVAGRECRGPITATPHSDTAVCQRCGDEWPKSRWQLLGRLQDTA